MLQIETICFSRLQQDARVLMEEHSKLFAIPDLDAYVGDPAELEEFEREGRLDITLASQEEGAVAYLAWMLGEHQGLPGKSVARMGPWYVRPTARSTGLALPMFKHALKSLREKKVDIALPTFPLRRMPPSGWLSRLGARPFEMTWFLPLQTPELRHAG